MLSISKVGQVVFEKCYLWRIIRITRRYARHKHERLFKTDWFSKKNPIRLYSIHSCAFQKLCYCSKRALFQKKLLSRRRLLPTKKAEQPPLAAKLPSFKTSGCFQGVGYFAPFSAPAFSFFVSNPNRWVFGWRLDRSNASQDSSSKYNEVLVNLNKGSEVTIFLQYQLCSVLQCIIITKC